MRARLLTIKEVAARLGVSVNTIRCWVRGYYDAGRGPRLTRPFIKPLRIGRQLMFKESELEQWIELQTI